jgi:hypothetical protein
MGSKSSHDRDGQPKHARITAGLVDPRSFRVGV